MFEKNSTFVYLIFVLSGIFGARLLGLMDTDSTAGEISRFDMIQSLIGFVLLLGSIIGFLVVFTRNKLPMTRQQESSWKQIRVKGKDFYVRNLLINSSTVIISSVLLLIFINYLKGAEIFDSLKIYGAIAIVLIVSVFFVAQSFWDYNEKEYKNLESEKPFDNMPE